MAGAVRWVGTGLLGKTVWEGEEERFSVVLGSGTGDRSVCSLWVRIRAVVYVGPIVMGTCYTPTNVSVLIFVMVVFLHSSKVPWSSPEP